MWRPSVVHGEYLKHYFHRRRRDPRCYCYVVVSALAVFPSSDETATSPTIEVFKLGGFGKSVQLLLSVATVSGENSTTTKVLSKYSLYYPTLDVVVDDDDCHFWCAAGNWFSFCGDSDCCNCGMSHRGKKKITTTWIRRETLHPPLRPWQPNHHCCPQQQHCVCFYNHLLERFHLLPKWALTFYWKVIRSIFKKLDTLCVHTPWRHKFPEQIP